MVQKTPGNWDPIQTFTGQELCSSLAVYAFFLVSGIFITRSFDQNPRPARFLLARSLRIWPGLVACAVVTAFVIGPLMSSDTLTGYFSNPTTYTWPLTVAGVFFGTPPFLPGLFEHNHTPFVNIALWTLPIEIKCYALVLLLGTFGMLSTKRKAIISIVVCAISFFYMIRHPPAETSFFYDVFMLQGSYNGYPVAFFLIGMTAYVFRDKIIIDGRMALALVISFVVLRHSHVATAIYYSAFTYGILWVGSTPVLRKLNQKHDYSYGVYIYGFFVQQCVQTLLPSITNYQSLLIAIPAALVLAALSWHLVESPCLALLRRNKAAPISPDVTTSSLSSVRQQSASKP